MSSNNTNSSSSGSGSGSGSKPAPKSSSSATAAPVGSPTKVSHVHFPAPAAPAAAPGSLHPSRIVPAAYFCYQCEVEYQRPPVEHVDATTGALLRRLCGACRCEAIEVIETPRQGAEARAFAQSRRRRAAERVVGTQPVMMRVVSRNADGTTTVQHMQVRVPWAQPDQQQQQQQQTQQAPAPAGAAAAAAAAPRQQQQTQPTPAAQQPQQQQPHHHHHHVHGLPAFMHHVHHGVPTPAAAAAANRANLHAALNPFAAFGVPMMVPLGGGGMMMGGPFVDGADGDADDGDMERVIGRLFEQAQASFESRGRPASATALLRVKRFTVPERAPRQQPRPEEGSAAGAAEEPEEEGHPCTVCMEAPASGDECVELPCGHVFHAECIGPWFNAHDTCPCCRRVLEAPSSNGGSGSNSGNTSPSAPAAAAPARH